MSNSWSQIESLFHLLCDLPPESRLTYLAAIESRFPPKIIAEVRTLLSAWHRFTNFMERSVKEDLKLLSWIFGDEL